MNIVDRLTRAKPADEMSREAKARHDALYSQIRAGNPHLGPENIDLSQVNFELTDDETRGRIARELGITAQDRIDAIDLDAIVSPSGEHRRRARRAYERQREAKRARGQKRFRRQQRTMHQREVSQPSGHEKVVAQRTEKAQMVKVSALIARGVDPREAYEQVMGS